MQASITMGEGTDFMGTSRTIAGAIAAVLILAACAGSGSADHKAGDADPKATTTTTVDTAKVDTAKVDAIIGEAVHGTQLTTNPSGTAAETLSVYTAAANSFTQTALALQDGLAGVPHVTTQAGSVAFRKLATRLKAKVTCLQNTSPSASSSATPCTADTAADTNLGLSAGAAIASLIPYGTRSEAEVEAALAAPPN
jgi:hypothetical protein